MTCRHKTVEKKWVTKYDTWTDQDFSHWATVTTITTKDIDADHYQCTQCGKVMSYLDELMAE